MTKEKFCKNIAMIAENIGLDYGICHVALQSIHEVFQKDENGFSHVEHYCFEQNFGKPSPDAEYESASDLYERLTKNN